jgi:TPR repeat protein
MAKYLKLLRAPFISTIMLVVAVDAVAGPMDDVNAAYKRGDFTAALAVVRPLADKGVAQAQYQLGYIYYIGLGVPQDYVTAARWYEGAAVQNR